jgi:hypothetical protein
MLPGVFDFHLLLTRNRKAVLWLELDCGAYGVDGLIVYPDFL